MSWKEYFADKARRKAGREKKKFGLAPPAGIAGLLEEGRKSWRLRESLRLLFYTLSPSPRHRMGLIWRYLTDKEIPQRTALIERLARDLELRLGSSCRISTTYFERRNYSRDLARIPLIMEKALFRTTPHLVVRPQHERDILEILDFCQSRSLGLFPRGTGSFAFGGAVPTRNGIVMDLSPMKAVCEVDPENLSVRVQPGARWADVTEILEPYGLAPITTPTSLFSTVGGWVSSGGMGLGCYASGSVHESVLRVRVARPNGVEVLDSRDESIKDLFGTEGQLGILTEITLRVRPKPEYSQTCLLTFDSPDGVVRFIDRLAASDHHPHHVVYFDREYMRRENILFAEKTGSANSIAPEKDALLLHFESAESGQEFLSSLDGNRNQVEENRLAASYLWADRFFPLKAQRLSPGLLGTEVVIPEGKVPGYIRKARRLARHFKVSPAIEGIVCRSGKFRSHLIILSFGSDYSRKLHYVLGLLLIQLLVRIAVRCSGYPYGTGIWNAPFVKSKYDKTRLDHLKNEKRAIDPGEILNPGKFFRIKGRFHSIPALFMSPVIFRTILALSHFFAPVLGLFAWVAGPKASERWDVPAKEDGEGKKLLRQSAQRCTSCGSCISVCPAYHITQDELVAGRTKLRMAEALMNGDDPEPVEAHSSFQCLHCGLCEEVCQTHLPLRDCYLVLEDWIASRLGYPTETIERFLEKLDSDRQYIKDVFGLDFPDWSPDEPMSRIPAAERLPERGIT
jgi:FAD/FMN-containing dehydrogenase/ferredoxin